MTRNSLGSFCVISNRLQLVFKQIERPLQQIAGCDVMHHNLWLPKVLYLTVAALAAAHLCLVNFKPKASATCFWIMWIHRSKVTALQSTSETMNRQKHCKHFEIIHGYKLLQPPVSRQTSQVFCKFFLFFLGVFEFLSLQFTQQTLSNTAWCWGELQTVINPFGLRFKWWLSHHSHVIHWQKKYWFFFLSPPCCLE